MINEKQNYTFKLKNKSICELTIQNNTIIEISKIYDASCAPIETFIFDEMNLSRLNDWFSSRSIPVNRDGLDQIIKTLNIDNVTSFLYDNLALSLSDQYWLKPQDADIEWNDINLFDNDYNILEFANAAFGKDNGLNASLNINKVKSSLLVHPNASLGGMLRKLWIKIDGIDYLIKSSNTILNLEPVNEVLASKIADILDVDAVRYHLTEIKGKRINQLVSICPNIVNSNEHLVSAYSIVRGYPEYKIKDYPSYINFLENELNIPNAREDIQKMFMLDFIILNEDRHLNNFGVIRNTDTLKWERVCPIYDTGKSLNTNISRTNWDFTNGEIKSFEGELVSPDYLMDMVDISITEEQIAQLNQLYDWYRETLFKHKDVLRISLDEIEELSNGLKERIEVFSNQMHKKMLVIESPSIKKNMNLKDRINAAKATVAIKENKDSSKTHNVELKRTKSR